MTAECATDASFGPAVGACRGGFDFTLAFEDIMLGLVPQASLLLLAPLRLATLSRRRGKLAQSSHLGFLKIVATLLYSVSSVLLLIFWSKTEAFRTRVSTATAAFEFAASLAVLILSYTEHRRAIRPSHLLQCFLLVLLVCDAVRLRTLFLMHYPSDLVSCLSVHAVLTGMLLVLESLDKRELLAPAPPGTRLSPEATLGLFSTRLFWHLNSLFWTGYKKVLKPQDLDTIDDSLCSDALRFRFQQQWAAVQRERKKTKKKSGARVLLYVIVRSIPGAVISPVMPRILHMGTMLAQPFLISAMIKFIEDRDDPSTENNGYGLIAAFCLNYVFIAIFLSWHAQNVSKFVTKVRTGMVSLIYEKTLQIAAQDVSAGSATVLMNVDVENVVEAAKTIHEFWAQAISASIALYILFTQLGISFIASVLTVLLATAISTYLGKKMKIRQRDVVAATEKRVNAVTYATTNTKPIRMLGLADSVWALLRGLREDEVGKQNFMRRLFVWIIAISNLMFQFTSLATYSMFALLALSRRESIFDFRILFASLSALKLVSTPLIAAIQYIPRFQNGMASLDRIQKYLESKDKAGVIGEQPEIGITQELGDAIPLSTFSRGVTNIHEDDSSISVRHASFGPNRSQILLKDIDLQVSTGSFTMIIGKVASGKTVLLQSLVGEMSLIAGEVDFPSSGVAYCAQSPWLRNVSLRENIIGESEFESQWYNKVCWACGLQTDFKEIKTGDKTLVGSRGITLSGGQKNRIALARAIYARKSTLLIDDMLAGIDSTTETLVFNRVFGKNGILRKAGSTVLLATHSTQWASEADRLVILSSGMVVEQGTYAALASSESYLSSSGISHKTSHKTSETEVAEDTEAVDYGNNTAHEQDDNHDDMRRSGDRRSLLYYMDSVGKTHMTIFTVWIILQTAMNTMQYVWLKIWAESPDTSRSGIVKNLLIFVAITLIDIVITWAGLAHFALTFMAKSSLNLHARQLKALMTALYSFIAATDIGNITNRFSQDMALVDTPLPSAWVNVAWELFACLAQVGIIATATPPVTAVIPFLIGVSWLIQRVYLRTSRQIRLMDLEAKAPLCTHFLETLAGITTVRAFGWSEAYRRKSNKLLYDSQVPFYLLSDIQNWLKLVLELTVAGLVTTIVVVAVVLREKVDPGYLGLALIGTMDIGVTIRVLIASWTELETSLSAVQRIRQFSLDTPTETQRQDIREPPASWPLAGSISIRNLSAAYTIDGKSVVQNLSITIKAGERIGLCGRTGSGKSSLVATLFGLLVKQEGDIEIDGIGIDEVPLSTLRSKYVALPQEPFFLKGTARFNLVPWASSQDSTWVSDDEMLSALEKVQLLQKLSDMSIAGESPLDISLDDIDSVFSHGEKQLFCLARAMLSPGRIVILDEATSGVDAATDRLMQKVLREAFQDRTIIVIAHRLNTILDFDRVVVMDAGQLVEVGNPSQLMSKESGRFRALVEQQMTV